MKITYYSDSQCCSGGVSPPVVRRSESAATENVVTKIPVTTMRCRHYSVCHGRSFTSPAWNDKDRKSCLICLTCLHCLIRLCHHRDGELQASPECLTRNELVLCAFLRLKRPSTGRGWTRKAKRFCVQQRKVDSVRIAHDTFSSASRRTRNNVRPSPQSGRGICSLVAALPCRVEAFGKRGKQQKGMFRGGYVNPLKRKDNDDEQLPTNSSSQRTILIPNYLPK